MFKAIIFDFDGVIVDSEELHYQAFAEVGKSLGFEMTWEQYLQTFIGYDDRDAFRAMQGQPVGQQGEPNQEAALLQLIEKKARVFEARVNAGVEPIAGVLDLIRQAASQMPLAISSGASARDIHLILRRISLGNIFKPIVTADDVSRSKPDPESYLLAVEQLAKLHPSLAIKPCDCLCIEDTAAGLASAKAAGLMTLGVLTSSTADELHHADRVIHSFNEVDMQKLHAWFD